MDLLHSWGAEVTAHLQTRYGGYEHLFNLATVVADLHTTFFWWFPVWFQLQRETGLKLVWVAVMEDWVNMVLKWVLFGERPYWWVLETKFYGTEPAPVLKQFHITCETGPGSPSGHAMGVVGVWYVMVTAALALAKQKQTPLLLYRFLQVGLWTLMTLVVVLACMSRLYMAAHFPHQVIAGIFLGLLVAEVVSRATWVYRAGLRNYIFLILFLTFSALGFYSLLMVAGLDLLWTMEKAKRWCVKPEWVNLSSTLFASLFRNMGALSGLALGLRGGARRGGGGTTFRTSCVVVSVVLLKLLEAGWTFTSKNHVVYYALCFAKNVLALLIPTLLAPSICRMFQSRKNDKNI